MKTFTIDTKDTKASFAWLTLCPLWTLWEM